jgi:hypothetical protein
VNYSSPSAPDSTYRTPLGQRLGGALALALLAPLAVGLALLAIMTLREDLAGGSIVALTALVTAALSAYLARDTVAKWRFLACFEPQAVTLRLPADRSLIHRPPGFRGRICCDAIDAIETRLEAYHSFGLAAMQRIYALRMRDGTRLILGEERALGTALHQAGVGELARIIAQHAGVPVVDLGMVEGRGGVLLVAGAAADEWDAPGVSQSAQSRLWRRVAWTGAWPLTVFLLAWVLASL